MSHVRDVVRPSADGHGDDEHSILPSVSMSTAAALAVAVQDTVEPDLSKAPKHSPSNRDLSRHPPAAVKHAPQQFKTPSSRSVVPPSPLHNTFLAPSTSRSPERHTSISIDQATVAYVNSMKRTIWHALTEV